MPGLATFGVTVTVKQRLALVTAHMLACAELRAVKGLQVCIILVGCFSDEDIYSCCEQLIPTEQISNQSAFRGNSHQEPGRTRC